METRRVHLSKSNLRLVQRLIRKIRRILTSTAHYDLMESYQTDLITETLIEEEELKSMSEKLSEKTTMIKDIIRYNESEINLFVKKLI